MPAPVSKVGFGRMNFTNVSGVDQDQTLGIPQPPDPVPVYQDSQYAPDKPLDAGNLMHTMYAIFYEILWDKELTRSLVYTFSRGNLRHIMFKPYHFTDNSLYIGMERLTSYIEEGMDFA